MDDYSANDLQNTNYSDDCKNPNTIKIETASIVKKELDLNSNNELHHTFNTREKTFTRKIYLNRYVKSSHHGIAYECDTCGQQRVISNGTSIRCIMVTHIPVVDAKRSFQMRVISIGTLDRLTLVIPKHMVHRSRSSTYSYYYLAWDPYSNCAVACTAALSRIVSLLCSASSRDPLRLQSAQCVRVCLRTRVQSKVCSGVDRSRMHVCPDYISVQQRARSTECRQVHEARRAAHSYTLLSNTRSCCCTWKREHTVQSVYGRMMHSRARAKVVRSSSMRESLYIPVTLLHSDAHVVRNILRKHDQKRTKCAKKAEEVDLDVELFSFSLYRKHAYCKKDAFMYLAKRFYSNDRYTHACESFYFDREARAARCRRDDDTTGYCLSTYIAKRTHIPLPRKCTRFPAAREMPRREDMRVIMQRKQTDRIRLAAAQMCAQRARTISAVIIEITYGPRQASETSSELHELTLSRANYGKLFESLAKSSLLFTREPPVQLTSEIGEKTSTRSETRYLHRNSDWMEPECRLCEEPSETIPYDFKVEIWALGITLIEFAQIEPPNHAISPMRVLLQASKARPPKLERRVAEKGESTISFKALNKDPTDNESVDYWANRTPPSQYTRMSFSRQSLAGGNGNRVHLRGKRIYQEECRMCCLHAEQRMMSRVIRRAHNGWIYSIDIVNFCSALMKTRIIIEIAKLKKRINSMRIDETIRSVNKKKTRRERGYRSTRDAPLRHGSKIK
ncbi:unnamed protein product [Trichogramma brassicae]|uniref:Protein kinase domain-containing protein n=1 Tax=Trichogramma brassicae TaxID=86971 RepID=A0A6H5IF61_9HYME|nr:unnamed protein product [Trichogramma brassicae]